MFNKNVIFAVLFAVGIASCQSSKDRKEVNTQATSEEARKAPKSAGSTKEKVADDEIKEAKNYTEFWLDRKKLEQELKEAIKEANADQENPVPYVRIAELAHLLDKVPLGRKACKKSLKNKPGFQSALLACAKIELADENFDLAELTLDKLSKKNQKRAVVLEMRALIKMKKGELNDAAIMYSNAAKLAPRNLRIQLNAGLLFMNYQQTEKARLHFANALRIERSNPVAQLHMAIIHLADNNLKKAESLLRDVEDDGDLGDYAKFHLARLMEKRGEFQKAADQLKGIKDKAEDSAIGRNHAKLTSRIQLFLKLEKELAAKIAAKKAYAEWAAKQKSKKPAKKGAK